MRVLDGRVWLSPSDVTAYLACEHLTALSLQVARGELPEPPLAGDQAELVFRKGLEHEQAYLAQLRRDGHDGRGDLARADRLGAGPPRPRSTRCARASTSSTRRRSSATAGAVSRTSSCASRGRPRSARGPTRPSTRSSPATRSPPTCSSSASTASGSGELQGLEPERIHVLLGNQRAGDDSVRGSSLRTSGASHAARSVRRRAARDASRTPSTAAGSASSSPSATRAGTPSTTSPASPASSAARSSGSSERGITDARRRSRAPTRARDRPGWPTRRSRSSAGRPASSSRRASTAATRSSSCAPQPESGFALLPDPVAGRPLLRLRGQPVLGRGRQPRVPLGQTRRGATSSRLAWATTTTRSGGAFESFVDLVHARLAAHPDLHVYHYAAYEITALRRMMGRYGTREAELDDLLAPRRLRRPLQGRRRRAAQLAARLRAEGDGAACSTSSAQRRDPRRRHVDRRVRARGCRRATTRSSTAIAAYNEEDCVATRVLRDWLLERRAEALAAVRPVPAAGAARAEAGSSRRRRRGGACARRCSTAGRSALRARGQLLDYHDRERKPVWWAFFDRLELTAGGARRGRGGDRRPRPGRRAARPRSARTRVRLHLPGAGAQARPAQHRRPGDRTARGRDRRSRP